MLPQIDQKKAQYIPGEEESKFILGSYRIFLDCKKVKDAPKHYLNGRTLQSFWQNSRDDFDVLTDISEEDDPVVPYSSTITRDMANGFIGNLTSQLLYPSVTAQNDNQEVDIVASAVARSLLEWAHNNDGYPTENGLQKSCRYTHTQVVEGTVHIQDDIIDGRHFSQPIPNEEIYILNEKQPNIQLQPFIFRVQENILYEEAERIYGMLPNWKMVIPGSKSSWSSDIINQVSDYKSNIEKHKVQIVHIWKDVPRAELSQGKEREKYYNVIINGVLMFKVGNKLPYDDGLYNISKGIFESFSDPNIYWGNSAPNKGRQDKKWLDGWKTLIRHKAKLKAIPPMITYNGFFIDSDVYIPGKNTKAPNGMKPEDIGVLPGITEGVSDSDIFVLNDAKNEIQQGAISAQGMGKQGNQQQTARESVIREENEQRMLGAIGQQVAFLVMQRTFPILRRLIQFISYENVKKICVPDQYVGEGKYGSMEIVFQDNTPMSEQELLDKSWEIRKQEKEGEVKGMPKKLIFIDKTYFNNLDLLMTALPEVKPKRTSAYRESKALEKYGVYASDPITFNKRAAARKLIREMGDDQSEMLNNEQPPAPEITEGQDLEAIAGKMKKTEGQLANVINK